MSVRTLFASALCLALAVAAASTLRAQNAEEDTSALEGKAAPDFSLTTLDGKDVKLSAMKGKVVVIDVWATWCPPCRESLPHVQKISADKELADKGLVVWAVNAREAKEKVRKFLTDNNYTFTVPMDTGAGLKDYKIRGIPTTVLVGRDGKVAKVFVGYGEGSAATMDEAVKAALAAK